MKNCGDWKNTLPERKILALTFVGLNLLSCTVKLTPAPLIPEKEEEIEEEISDYVKPIIESDSSIVLFSGLEIETESSVIVGNLQKTGEVVLETGSEYLEAKLSLLESSDLGGLKRNRYKLSVKASEKFSDSSYVKILARNGEKKDSGIIKVEAAYLEVESDSVEIADTAVNGLEIRLRTNIEYSKSSDVDWIQFSGGHGSSYLKLGIRANETAESRVGSVHLVGKHNFVSRKIVITQKRMRTDRDRLIAIYEALDGDKWTAGDKNAVRGAWCSDEPISEWSGVNCCWINGIPYVQHLHLKHFNLRDNFPKELGELKYLTELIICRNPELGGNLPDNLGKLSRLTQLSIYSTGVSGEIPHSLSRLKNLKILSICDNNLSGNLPDCLLDMPELFNFEFWGNNFDGEIPVEFTETLWWTSIVYPEAIPFGEYSMILGQKDGHRLWVKGHKDCSNGYCREEHKNEE